MNNQKLKAHWYIHMRQRGISEITILNYRSVMKKFDKLIDRPFPSLELSDVVRFFDSQHELSSGSKNFARNTLSSLFRYLYESGHLKQDIRGWLPKVDRTRKVKEDVLSVGQIRKLILTPDMNTPVGYRDRTMILTQYSGGLRVSELLGMTVDDIDVIRQTITVTRKGGEVQELPVGELAMEYLSTYVNEIRPHMEAKGDVMWINTKGKKIQYGVYSRALKGYMAECNIKGSSHDLRHAAGTHMMNAGAPIYGISVLLGHKDISSTEIYTRVNPVDIRGCVDRMGF